MLFLERLRTPKDRQHLVELFHRHWGHPLPLTPTPELTITPAVLKLGWASLPRTHILTDAIQPATAPGERCSKVCTTLTLACVVSQHAISELNLSDPLLGSCSFSCMLSLLLPSFLHVQAGMAGPPMHTHCFVACRCVNGFMHACKSQPRHRAWPWLSVAA